MTNTGIAALLLCCLLTACETMPAPDGGDAGSDAGAVSDTPLQLLCEGECPAVVSACCFVGGANSCVAILTDRANCGACGNECAGSCTNGVCE